MPDGFCSLATILAQRASAPHPSVASSTDDHSPRDAARIPAAAEPRVVDVRVSDLLDGFVAELARLRARAAEHLEQEAETLLAQLADRILARELLVAPANIEALVTEALNELASDARVVVRVSPADATRLGERVPHEVDQMLQPGDFAVDVPGGNYDASFQTRLETVLASHRVAL